MKKVVVDGLARAGERARRGRTLAGAGTAAVAAAAPRILWRRRKRVAPRRLDVTAVPKTQSDKALGQVQEGRTSVGHFAVPAAGAAARRHGRRAASQEVCGMTAPAASQGRGRERARRPWRGWGRRGSSAGRGRRSVHGGIVNAAVTAAVVVVVVAIVVLGVVLVQGDVQDGVVRVHREARVVESATPQPVRQRGDDASCGRPRHRSRSRCAAAVVAFHGKGKVGGGRGGVPRLLSSQEAVVVVVTTVIIIDADGDDGRVPCELDFHRNHHGRSFSYSPVVGM